MSTAQLDGGTRNRWNDAAAAAFSGPLGQRVYSSRLLGADPSLVLHGGGNTSLKRVEHNRFGDAEEILFVKGSGWDLGSIQATGFAPVRRQQLLRLAALDQLSDSAMMSELRLACTDPAAPAPSVESILHALFPSVYVDHTHADALLALSDTPNGERHARQAYGSTVLVVPYVMPGFDLAHYCAQIIPEQLRDGIIGVLLLNHGIFSFGETARESYERMIHLVQLAETYLAERHAWLIDLPDAPRAAAPEREAVASLRADVSTVAGFPILLRVSGHEGARAFARSPLVADLALQGPVTPDHVLRTKRLPLLGRDVGAYGRNYEAAFERFQAGAAGPLTMLDAAPRVILDPEWGLVTAGRTGADTAIAEEVYQHTIDVVMRAAALDGRYQALPEEQIFQVEYWDLEQAKLRAAGPPRMFTGEVALITGAASGIGKACAQAFAGRGAAVVALDLNPEIETQMVGPALLGIRCDVTDTDALLLALDRAALRFGGLDMLVLNAGVFPRGAAVAELPLADWQDTMRVNLDANLNLLRETYPLLQRAPRGGRVVVIGSKNVVAPGPGAAAYSASKAGLTQLARVAALEWAPQGIRVNVVHPDAVFDTGLWTDEVLQDRAARYGLSVDAYKRKNLLGVEVTSGQVAELVAEMCGPLFSRTTGAQIPIDGGNDRVV